MWMDFPTASHVGTTISVTLGRNRTMRVTLYRLGLFVLLSVWVAASGCGLPESTCNDEGDCLANQICVPNWQKEVNGRNSMHCIEKSTCYSNCTPGQNKCLNSRTVQEKRCVTYAPNCHIYEAVPRACGADEVCDNGCRQKGSLCQKGETRCDKGMLSLCEYNKELGDWKWSTPTKCPNSDSCDGNSCKLCDTGRIGCVGNTEYAVCVAGPSGEKWGPSKACPNKQICQRGKCVCRYPTCKVGTRYCSRSNNDVMICKELPGECPKFVKERSCDSNSYCNKGTCVPRNKAGEQCLGSLTCVPLHRCGKATSSSKGNVCLPVCEDSKGCSAGKTCRVVAGNEGYGSCESGGQGTLANQLCDVWVESGTAPDCWDWPTSECAPEAFVKILLPKVSGIGRDEYTSKTVESHSPTWKQKVVSSVPFHRIARMWVQLFDADNTLGISHTDTIASWDTRSDFWVDKANKTTVLEKGSTKLTLRIQCQP